MKNGKSDKQNKNTSKFISLADPPQLQRSKLRRGHERQSEKRRKKDFIYNNRSLWRKLQEKGFVRSLTEAKSYVETKLC